MKTPTRRVVAAAVVTLVLGAAAFLARPGHGTSIASASEPEASGRARTILAVNPVPANIVVNAVTDPETGATCYVAVVKNSGAVSIDCLPTK